MSVTFFCDPGKWSRNQQFLGALVLAVIVLLLAPVGIEGEEPLHLGHDYGYFLPHLLNGYYWFLANGLSIPWFTPAFCAGIPFFANPQSLYYSVPQLLTFLVDPLASVMLTYYLFGWLGFIGCYWLASLYNRSSLISCFAGMAFMLNGFYASRMVVGHLSFHAFMLLPLILFLLLKISPTGREWPAAIVVGVLLAYFVHAGAGVIIVPVGVCMLVVMLSRIHSRGLCKRLVFAGAIAAGLSLSKLVAVSYFMGEFHRPSYSLPGFQSILPAMHFALTSLTWPLDSSTVNQMLVNKAFAFGDEGANYAVGIAPLAIALGGLLKYHRQVIISKLVAVLMLGILSLPLLVNIYSPDWHPVLKSLPYFSSASSLLRWQLIYILPVILMACVVLERVRESLSRGWPVLMSVVILSVVLPALLMDTISHTSVAKRPYDAAQILRGYYAAKTAGAPPPITHHEESLSGRLRMHFIGADDALARGASQIVCYEPLFGYRLESFRFDRVFVGGALAQHDGHYNFYRPECMLYPAQNACAAGDRFAPDQLGALQQFTRYQSMPFELPWLQRLANVITLLTVIATVLLLVVSLVLQVIPMKCKQRHCNGS
ncbi:MAG: hypothetical protein HOB98_15145 [Gammaproteobacteria bacterium]|jgi:hypothetical protein|nr:hypothetical protein [Gammaproteobacteria bacterium]MBT3866893.1 hypothetical protein [Gammaproteobacteria bacterium]MBT4378395.1 hypothetical protein [Gammaproteobacteria bacterium]MBT4617780.1 hypothetical protein [Gammaproteobacteria bacterium]MBT5197742.1 hypothetical protein [Gammaproteobacteria bacterium]